MYKFYNIKFFLVKKTLHFCQSKVVSRKEGIVQCSRLWYAMEVTSSIVSCICSVKMITHLCYTAGRMESVPECSMLPWFL